MGQNRPALGRECRVNSSYVDATSNVVLPKKLNLRAGPGENYSVLGVIEKGAAVTSVSTKGDWIQIETPSSRLCFRSCPLFETGSSGSSSGSSPSSGSGSSS